MGSLMFLTFCSPIGSKPNASFFSTSFATLPETQMPPGVGKLLETRRDVDAVAMPVRALHDHFAEVDSNANIDALILRLAGVSLRHSSLDIDRALNRIDDAPELGQEAIAHELEDAAAMLRYCRFNEFIAVSLDPLERFSLRPAPSSGCSRQRQRQEWRRACVP